MLENPYLLKQDAFSEQNLKFLLEVFEHDLLGVRNEYLEEKIKEDLKTQITKN